MLSVTPDQLVQDVRKILGDPKFIKEFCMTWNKNGAISLLV